VSQRHLDAPIATASDQPAVHAHRQCCDYRFTGRGNDAVIRINQSHRKWGNSSDVRGLETHFEGLVGEDGEVGRRFTVRESDDVVNG
jgi:hypothetical protein